MTATTPNLAVSPHTAQDRRCRQRRTPPSWLQADLRVRCFFWCTESPLHARGVKVSVAIDGAADFLDDSQEALIYRVAQEAVRNVLAYSDARTVDVELTSAEGVVHLVVRDDGSGFSPEVRERGKAEGHLGLGLSLLEELVRQAGGRLDVRSGEGQGTTVELEVPPR